MKKILFGLFLCLLVCFGYGQSKEQSPKVKVTFQKNYTLIPMGDSTTLQIQYEPSGNIVQLKLPAKPDMVLKKTERMTYKEDSATGQKYLLIKFNLSYTTEFAYLTGKHKEDYLAMIADGKVLTVPVVKERITTHTLHIMCTGTKSENLKLMERIKGKPIDLYFIPRK